MALPQDYSYRSDPMAAQQLIMQMQPDPVRRWWCLGILVDAIQASHRANGERWGVTLFKNLVRLNVGMIEVYVFDATSTVYMVLDATTLATNPTTHSLLCKNAQNNLKAYQRREWESPYRSVAGALGTYLELEKLPQIYPLLRSAHQALLRRAAQTRRHGETRGSHSPGIIDYLHTETDWPLPQPAYVRVPDDE